MQQPQQDSTRRVDELEALALGLARHGWTVSLCPGGASPGVAVSARWRRPVQYQLVPRPPHTVEVWAHHGGGGWLVGEAFDGDEVHALLHSPLAGPQSLSCRAASA